MDAAAPEITAELLQANPGLAVCLLIMMAVIILGGVGAIATWIWLIIMLLTGRNILPAKTWTPRPWGLVELVLTACCLFATSFLLVRTAAPMLGLDLEAASAAQANGQPLPLVFQAITGSAYLLTVLTVTVWICVRFAKSPGVVGWSLRGLPKNVLVGLLGGLAFLPLLFMINIAVTLISQVKYNHPLFKAMENDGTGTNYLLAVFAAAIVAPIAEEFFFRVLLQGWLQSIQFVHPMQAVLGKIGFLYDPAEQPSVEDPGSEAEMLDSELPAMDGNPYQPVHSYSLASSEHGLELKPPIWPSVVAGTLFGLAHWGFGLSFIPLIVMGVFLGLLYRATQSIWPCIIVHFMLNATAMGALGIKLYVDSVTGTVN